MAVIECPHCGQRLEIGEKAILRNGHQQSSRRDREWLIIADGETIHRCNGEPAPLGHSRRS